MLVRSNAYNNEIEFFELATGRLKKYFLGHRSATNSLAILSDDRLLVSGSRAGTVKFWDLETGDLQASIVLLPKSSDSPRQWQCLTGDGEI